MSDQPLVSIGIPTFSRVEGLKRTLTCLTQQTYQNLDIHVSNDASPVPELQHVIDRFAAEDSRIRVTHHKQNIGAFRNFAYVLHEAKGEYFMWASDDDEWKEDFVEKCLAAFAQRPDYKLIFTRFKVVSQYDYINFRLNHNWYLRSRFKKLWFLLLDVTWNHKAHMLYGLWKTELAQQVYPGFLTEKHLGKGMDEAMLLRVLDMTEVYQIQEELFIKHYDEMMIPGSINKSWISFQANIRDLLKHPLAHVQKATKASTKLLECITLAFPEPSLLDRLALRLKWLLVFIHYCFF